MELHLSGEKLKLALQSLGARADEQGGVEAYVEALKAKSELFRGALAEELDLKTFRLLCAYMPTVRRRIGRHAEPDGFEAVRLSLLSFLKDSGDVDRRISDFSALFPDDRDHRWVRDLAAELLHYRDPERYPLMTRWMWDARTNTGVLREIWHDENVDSIRIDVPDRYDMFLQLREELAQYLTQNGVYRDVLFYVDMLCAQVYAEYIGERGGTYLRADVGSHEDPMLHARRILGLDGVSASGRTRLRAADGKAEMIQ